MMRILTLFFFWAICFNAFAQKLPAMQQVSLRAPANVKIDGKANEWGNKLQAYNPATEIYYTMANDDKKLYLTVQATGWTTITNILNGGIKLAIQKNGEINDAGAPFIKFPYPGIGKSIMIPPKGQQHPDPDTAMMQDNKLIAAKIKLIYTKGLPGVDTLLSVYNDNGVAAANSVDIKRLYTCEMAVDLSLMGLSAENASKFSYHIMVNAEPNKYGYSGVANIMQRVISSGNTPVTEQMTKNMAKFENDVNNSTATTDFWGEYTLAK